MTAGESPYTPLECGVGDIEALGREVAELRAHVDCLRVENLRLTAKNVLLDVNRRAALWHAKELRRVFRFTLDLRGPIVVRDVCIDPHMKASAEEACRNFDTYLATKDSKR